MIKKSFGSDWPIKWYFTFSAVFPNTPLMARMRRNKIVWPGLYIEVVRLYYFAHPFSIPRKGFILCFFYAHGLCVRIGNIYVVLYLSKNSLSYFIAAETYCVILILAWDFNAIITKGRQIHTRIMGTVYAKVCTHKRVST